MKMCRRNQHMGSSTVPDRWRIQACQVDRGHCCCMQVYWISWMWWTHVWKTSRSHSTCTSRPRDRSSLVSTSYPTTTYWRSLASPRTRWRYKFISRSASTTSRVSTWSRHVDPPTALHPTVSQTSSLHKIEPKNNNKTKNKQVLQQEAYPAM